MGSSMMMRSSSVPKLVRALSSTLEGKRSKSPDDVDDGSR
eukprot:CAMPEP_0114050602 /NCGR_PEP_ID=MMETSP1339-20121228/65499_1 /TAXON_ID=94617 /ORGANISM="Fibrocapsa japonica" /LENGTH=39 /assembly_acc=CAM_ASM_000762